MGDAISLCGKKGEFIECRHRKRPYANKVASSPTSSKDGKSPCCVGPQSLISHSWALSIFCQEGSHTDMSALKARNASASRMPPFWLLWLLPPLDLLLEMGRHRGELCGERSRLTRSYLVSGLVWACCPGASQQGFGLLFPCRDLI